MITVIPAYEPDDRLLNLVIELREKTDYRIIIVDDGSASDKQPLFLKLQEYATVLHHDINRGKGRAMKTAFKYIRDNYTDEDGIITVDADGQHLLKDIIHVSEEWNLHRDSLLLGSRKFAGKVPLRSRFGNSITRFVFAISTGVKVFDTQTGLRAFSTQLLEDMIEISGERYEYEINQLLTATKRHIPIIEIDIDTVYLGKNETSHFNTFRDSWRIYKTIFAFMGSSFASWLVDYSLLLLLTYAITAWTGGAGLLLFGVQVEPKLPALVIARIVSSIVNYIINKKLVFAVRSKGSILRYYISVVIMLALNYGLIYLIGDLIPLWIAQILVQLVVYPINFIVQREFVFPVKDEAKNEIDTKRKKNSINRRK